MTLQSGVLSEVKVALRRTSSYLLSHHQEGAHHRCYAFSWQGRTVRVCARCLGIWPGIIIGIILPGAILLSPVASIAAVAVLPSFALIDWARSAFTARKGTNAVRTLTGLLLGIAYGIGITLLMSPARWSALAVGAGYIVVAGALLLIGRRAPESGQGKVYKEEVKGGGHGIR